MKERIATKGIASLTIQKPRRKREKAKIFDIPEIDDGINRK
jgi:hypothetical protein